MVFYRAAASSFPRSTADLLAQAPKVLQAPVKLEIELQELPEEDRQAMVVRIDLDKHAQIVDRDFMAAVIHSKARLDYPGVPAALGGDTRGKRRKYEPFLPALRAMGTALPSSAGRTIARCV